MTTTTTAETLAQNQPIEKFYSVTELTALGIGSRSKIDRLVKNGTLKRYKIGNSSRFKASDIQAYINA
ncbi:excisionase family DNA binding protein [Cricetibacter osteomyelitidis]|uniref:Excisionase family DNA binding protein n=1 Tax=Cricetibacter osteomyelitidis TaxID=1521931 RepID=A0A4R2SXU4_9PAST|nr:helix-turn-helix domain-containing protein [Cricetibacter osteomyelitidis]TCP95339.1 excisionase family DNA binding protein [Cricetibacter osteomyelitidis]